MTQVAMTPNDHQSKIVLPKRPRRISPDCAEVLHVLAAFEAKPDQSRNPGSDKA